jgi:hypothetical protein
MSIVTWLGVIAVVLGVLLAGFGVAARKFAALQRRRGRWDEYGPLEETEGPPTGNHGMSERLEEIGEWKGQVLSRRRPHQPPESYPRTLDAAAIPPALATLVGEIAQRLLSGSTPVHAALRRQLAASTIREIELTGVGFFAYFGGLTGAEPVAPVRLIGGDVPLNVAGLEHGAGSLVCVEDGLLECVEVYTYGSEAWPDDAKVLSFGDATPLPVTIVDA